MTKRQVGRYSRQLLMSEIGVHGQRALLDAKVLIVGMGGLGCPAAMYLVAAGIGECGLLDYDTVEETNLHRQVLHSEKRVGMSKAESASVVLKGLNSECRLRTHILALSRENALAIVQDYDLVLDCTDNVATRYLLNDACVLAGKALVSASALRTEGQLTVYGFNGGPCYRCLFPQPPPASTVVNCSDGGVIGCLVGVLGSMQAMEAVKVLLYQDCQRRGAGTSHLEIMSQRMLLYHGFLNTFRKIRLRGRREDCAVCGDAPSITPSLIDYEVFCGSKACDKSKPVQLLSREKRIECHEYAEVVKNGEPHILLDVREKLQFDICSLDNSLHIPLEELPNSIGTVVEEIERVKMECGVETHPALFVICRRGNRSQYAVNILEDHGIRQAKDIIGGLTTWSLTIDPEFPMY